MNLYKVEFTFDDSYRPKTEGFRNIALTVLAKDKFTALSNAWEMIKLQELPEPKSCTASRCNSSDE